MMYVFEIGSEAMIYVLIFLKTGLAIQKLMGDAQTHRQEGDCIILL
jgi:hypothetical protein